MKTILLKITNLDYTKFHRCLQQVVSEFFVKGNLHYDVKRLQFLAFTKVFLDHIFN